MYAKSSFKDAIETYDKALSTCPNYLDYEIAVLQSNIAACHLKLEDWKEAIKTATAALDGLDKLQGQKADGKKDNDGEEEADEEIISAGAEKAEDTSTQGKREADIERIRTKALLRRARARSELGGWSSLQGADEGTCRVLLSLLQEVMTVVADLCSDYKTLSQMTNLSGADRKVVQRQLAGLPARIKEAQETEMGEMMGKLKQVSSSYDVEVRWDILTRQLGNGILKPFGLSTENFQMVKDEKTGGYSMNFNQGGPPT